MSVRLDIWPVSPSVDMFGTVHTSTAYSLSGNVLITVTPTTSFFSSQTSRPPAFRLKSLSIIFEGKTECISPTLGYAATRLCRIERTLVGSSPSSSNSPAAAPPFTLVCAGGDPDEACWQWTVLFDLSIPGWLPPSLQLSDYTETSYSLHAFATIETLEPPPSFSSSTPHCVSSPSSSWSSGFTLPTLMASLLPSSLAITRPKDRRIESEPLPIMLTRFHIPSTSLSSPSPSSPYPFPIIHEDALPFVLLDQTSGTSKIPLELLKGMEVIVSFPERVDLDEGSMPLGLRIRGVPDVLKGRRLRMVEFEVQVYQVENIRSVEDPSFAQNFPIPPPSHQPPALRLLNANLIGHLAEHKLFPSATSTDMSGRCPTKGQRRHALMPDTLAFYRPSGSTKGGLTLDQRWARMDVSVPLLRPSQEGEEEDGKELANLPEEKRADRARRRKLIRPSSHAPLARVSHEMHIFLHMSWDPSEGGEDGGSGAGLRTDVVRCIVDLDFTRVPREMKARVSQFSSLSPLSSSVSLSPTSSPTLPASYFFSGSAPSSPTSSIASSLPPSTPLDPMFSALLESAKAILPAYNQLFHENGERREYDADQYGCWLPSYGASEAEAATMKVASSSLESESGSHPIIAEDSVTPIS